MNPDAWRTQDNRVVSNNTREGMMTALQLVYSEPLFSAATIRKWLEEEISQQIFDAGAYCTGGFEDTYRAMLAAKLQELEQEK